ncbi:FAR1-related sequence 5-like protein [Tanacetum coccineum]
MVIMNLALRGLDPVRLSSHQSLQCRPDQCSASCSVVVGSECSLRCPQTSFTSVGVQPKGKVNSVANGKGKCKVTNDGFSVKRKNDDASNVSKPDDGFSGTGKNIDVAIRSLFRKNTSCKTGCLARMMIMNVDGDMFEVYGFVEEHNHPLVSQDDMQFMMSSRELDAQMVVEKLENLEKRCKGFFMDYFQGEGDSLCGLFWADKVAKLNYQRFGDTISFDATFKSNKYRMVFVPFTGIDNHNRLVTFGAGLLSDETFRSYKWLLQSFKKIPAFLRDEDMSRLMRTASRSESENRYFNRFTNPDLTLLEKEVAELFMLNIFYEIQDEIVASIAKCFSVNVEQMGRFEKCYIRDTEVKKWEDST